MVANILPTDTPSTQGVGSKGQTIYFSESSHVAYQIKADDTGSKMVANIMPTDTPSTQGVGSKGQIISLYPRYEVYRGYIVFTFSVIMFVCLLVCLSVCKLFFRHRFLSNYLG